MFQDDTLTLLEKDAPGLFAVEISTYCHTCVRYALLFLSEGMSSIMCGKLPQDYSVPILCPEDAKKLKDYVMCLYFLRG